MSETTKLIHRWELAKGRGILKAPSHVTKGQAAHILGSAHALITYLIRRKRLPVERWYGVEMIPMPAVLRYLQERDARRGGAQ